MKTIEVPEDLTPTQSRMLQLLADGEAHLNKELQTCLQDDLGPVSNIWAHLTAIRKVLRPRGQDIQSERRGSSTYYRWIDHVNGSNI